MIKRGPRSTTRRHAKNFIQEHAQKRLDESVLAFNHQVENSLQVDAVEVEIYNIERLVGTSCSCCKTDTAPVTTTSLPPVIPNKENLSDYGEIEFQDSEVFGNSALGQMLFNDDDDLDVQDSGVTAISLSGLDDEDNEYDTAVAGSVNCGICYRTTMTPAFKCYGKQRHVFTHRDIVLGESIFINSTKAPHCIEKTAGNGFAKFKVVVPKYFKSVCISIRNNLDILHDLPLIAGNQIDAATLRHFAGTEIEFDVDVDAFTHVVMEFDLGVTKIKANIGGETTTLDYDRLQTMSDIPIVFGPSLSHIDIGDIVCIPKRNLYLKIRDRERKITATQRRLEWVCTARVLQPQEPLTKLSKGYKLI